jgi:RHS Repeat
VHDGVAGSQTARYTFGYDPAGRLRETTYPGGLTTDRAYDRAGRLVDVNTHGEAGTAVRYQLTLDPMANPTAVTTTRGTRSRRPRHLQGLELRQGGKLPVIHGIPVPELSSLSDLPAFGMARDFIVRGTSTVTLPPTAVG